MYEGGDRWLIALQSSAPISVRRSVVAKERPILFSGEMVKAILEGSKTQTRRVVKPQPGEDGIFEPAMAPGSGALWKKWAIKKDGKFIPLKCPYGKPGDRLWVRETHFLYGKWVKNGHTKIGRQKWKFVHLDNTKAMYMDSPPDKICKGKKEIGWFKRPSIFMPRWASRIGGPIKDIRIERVGEITERDAGAEGINSLTMDGFDSEKKDFYNKREFQVFDPVRKFRLLWDSLNAKKGFGFDKSPYVWVIEFERVKP